MPVTATPRLYFANLPGGGAAVMDVRTGRGQWQHLNPTVALLWRRLIEGADPARAVDDLPAAFTGEGTEPGFVRADLHALVGQLREVGLLDARTAPAPGASDVQVREALPSGVRLSVAERAAGLAALATALLLLRCAPIRASIATARAVARMPLRPATSEKADRLFRGRTPGRD